MSPRTGETLTGQVTSLLYVQVFKWNKTVLLRFKGEMWPGLTTTGKNFVYLFIVI